ncbi:MAG: hypothetical protein AAFV29_23575, partial [Myxococcota bacterium]
YSVSLGPEASPGGHIQVTAYGSSAYCSVAPSGPLAELWTARTVNIVCARGGTPVDTRFSLLGIKRMDVLGLRSPTFGGATAPTAFICPTDRTGDTNFGGVFGGNGARVTTRFDLTNLSNRVELDVNFTAVERNGGDSSTRGQRRLTLGIAPTGMRYGTFLSPPGGRPSQLHTFDSTGSPTGEDFRTFNFPSTSIVRNLQAVGDTSGSDISTDANCTNDTRLQRFTLNPIRVSVVPN